MLKFTRSSIVTGALSVALMASSTAFAANVVDIKYSEKGNSMLNGEYRIYKVSCSDGKTKKISAWDKRRQWCVGTSKRNCSNDQLKTAKRACK